MAEGDATQGTVCARVPFGTTRTPATPKRVPKLPPQRPTTTHSFRASVGTQGPGIIDSCGPTPIWCVPDQTISGRGNEGDRHGPVLRPPYATRRTTAVPQATLCCVEHTFPSYGSTLQSLLG